MYISTIYPETAEYLENDVVVTIADFKGDHYGGILPERLIEPLHQRRIRTRTDHDVEPIVDERDEVIGYRVTTARYHLIVEDPHPAETHCTY